MRLSPPEEAAAAKAAPPWVPLAEVVEGESVTGLTKGSGNGGGDASRNGLLGLRQDGLDDVEDGALHPLANRREDLGDKVWHAVVDGTILISDKLSVRVAIALDTTLEAVLNDPLERDQAEVELHGGGEMKTFLCIGGNADCAGILGG